ncbi:MAG: DinB family protein [Promethearchaeota archaeon]
MLHDFLINAVTRLFRETKLIVDQLTDQLVTSKPIESGRPLGEIFLHIIRSAEFYLRGLVEDKWEPLPYNLETYGTAQAIQALYKNVNDKMEDYIKQLAPDMMTEVIDLFNRPATKAEILQELIEHTIHHRGQIIVYYRLLGIEPATIPYII